MAQANPTPTPTPTREPLTMEPGLRPLDPDAKPISNSSSNIINCSKTLTLPLPLLLPNGGGIKRQPPPPQQLRLPAPPDSLYRECLKNHAATLGGHALDGCGEFMPSPAATPADPTSLKCAACSCHRNFHRRVPLPRDDETDDDDDDRRRQSSSSPPPYYSSAPHMLLALSTGIANPAAAARPGGGPAGSRKRFRTRFSPEQKERMQDLSERLGWRMQKRDEGMVEDSCREIGVRKGVFKVWMHNNKHNFVPGSSRRGEIIGGGGAATAAADAIMAASAAAAAAAGIEGNGVVGAGAGNGVVVNGSSSSS